VFFAITEDMALPERCLEIEKTKVTLQYFVCLTLQIPL